MFFFTASVMTAPGFVASFSRWMGALRNHDKVDQEVLEQQLNPLKQLAIGDSDVHLQ